MSLKMSRIGLLATASMAGLLSCGAQAFAQERSVNVQEDSASVEELIVTARRREERLQEVPVSVTSLAGDRLEAANVTDTQSLTAMVPGLNFTTNGGIAQPNIRGIGTTNTNRGDEANVAMYVDGIYQSNMNTNVFQLSDVERVEVLKGPQGTLYGRNATGGAINIITRNPEKDFGAELTLGVGRFNERLVQGFVTGGAGRVAASLSFSYDTDDGYIRDILRDVKEGQKESVSARAKIAIDLTDTWRVTLGHSYASDDTAAFLAVQPVNGNTAERAQARPGVIPTAKYTTALNQSPRNLSQAHQTFVRVEGEIGTLGFQSQSSLTHDMYKNAADVDFSSRIVNWSANRSVVETIQQEFLLTSPVDSKIKWVAGLFGFKQNAGYHPQLTWTASGSTSTLRTVFSTLDTYSVAPFGEVTVPITDDISVTGGARYTWERKEFRPMLPNGSFDYTAREWTQFTPRVVLQYIRPDVVNLYGSWSKGFKSGHFSTQSTDLTPVNPEKVTAFEVGVKTLMPGPWRASASAFHYGYKDIQVTAFNVPNITRLLNAAEAEIYGGEVEGEFRVATGLTLNGSVTYTHGTYTKFPNAVIQIALPQGGNQTVNNVDISGTPVTRTPEWTAKFGVNYVRPLFDGEMSAALNVAYSDEFSWDLSNRYREPEHTLVSGSISWSPSGERYEITIWGRNLTNEYYAISGNSAARGDSMAPGQPRSLGVRLKLRL